jgi:hypothetical protein
MVNGCERNYHRALKELQRLKAQVGQALSPANVPPNPGPVPQKPAATTPQPQQPTPTSANLASFRDISQTPASSAPKPPDAPANSVAGTASPQPSAADCDLKQAESN